MTINLPKKKSDFMPMEFLFNDVDMHNIVYQKNQKYVKYLTMNQYFQGNLATENRHQQEGPQCLNASIKEF